MMKRTGVPRLGPEDPTPLPQQTAPQMQQPPQQPPQQAGASNMHTLAQTAQPQILGGTAMLSVGGSFSRGARAPPPPVLNYIKTGAVQYAAPKQPPHQPPRLKQPSLPPAPPLGGQSPGAAASQPPPQFQRLKVEDALTYLDQVKFKFNTQPQVYNDFLDIMKEFKSQTIDTPGVITRVSNLFTGHPELIVGFNTFLPPGYKIEVQSNGKVSVSMPSPTGLGVGVHLHHAGPQPQLLHLLPVAQSVSSAIVHKLQVTAPPTAIHHLPPRVVDAPATHHVTPKFEGTVQPPAIPAQPPGQPVEFNHAIEYVNKIKSRFSRQPDKYKRFLEILHAYQRGHRDVKEPQAKQHTEQQVYSQVAKLFENQEDLLAEFGQFLPDAKAVTKPSPQRSPPLPHGQMSSVIAQAHIEQEQERFANIAPEPPVVHLHPQPTPPKPAPAPPSAPTHHLKRSPSFTSSHLPSGAPPAKKPRASALSGATVRDVSYAEAAKLATLHDYNFFDRVRKALRSQHVYDNFLRCLLLYTNEIISASELVSVTQPFLARQPELQRQLRKLLRANSPPNVISYGYTGSGVSGSNSGTRRYESVGPLTAQLRHDRPPPEIALDIDLNTCKRLGASYVALPREAANRKCSGRTPLCKEVLNDTWVSFPSWSEDSTFVTSRKTQYEEYIYRCEDERFELDVVIETNASTIRVLEGVQKKLARMSPEETASYRLDDCLGGQSATIHQRALRRIYGDKAVDIIAGLKKNPAVAVPVVLRRLKAKEEEWRDAQKGFNKQWREQNEKYYLKSLDHQGINFKQNDLKAMRSKCLFNEVESAYAAGKPGPHLVVDYNTRSRQEAIKIAADAAELLIHHARRQTAIQKAEKRRIKQLLRQFLPDLFAHPRQPLSDDERDEEEKDDLASPDSPSDAQDDRSVNSTLKQEKHESSESDNASDKSSRHNKNDKENKPKNNNNMDKSKEISISKSNPDILKTEPKADADMEEDLHTYGSNEARFVCTSAWYMFLRVHGAICQRLCAALCAASAKPAPAHKHAAAALRLCINNLPTSASSPSEYYKSLLELVKGVLDGNVEPSTYEDAAREMFGIKAYPVYTLDKLVSIAVRQLQHVVSEPWSLAAAELARGGMRGSMCYVRRARRHLSPQHTAFLVTVYGGSSCRVTFELLETAAEGGASPRDKPRLSPSRVRTRPPNKPVFLRRNVARAVAALGCGIESVQTTALCRAPATGAGASSAGGSHRRKAPPAGCVTTPKAWPVCWRRPRRPNTNRSTRDHRTPRFRAWLAARTSLQR